MKTNPTLKLGLNANEFHAGLNEILKQFATVRKEDYFNALVNEVQVANQALFDSMHIAEVKRNAYREAQLLTSRIVSVQRYADSCRYVDDQNVKASAEHVLALFKSYDKAFARMTTYTRIGAVRTLQRDLASDSLQEHVNRLPEMAERIASVQSALTSLEEKLLEVDAANSASLSSQPLLPLKRVAAEKLRTLVEYLAVMSAKEPESFEAHYKVVMEVINNLNAKRQKGHAATPTSEPMKLAVEPEPDLQNRVG